MIKRFINFVKKDYTMVRYAMMELTNGKIPVWAFNIYYAALAPIGLLLYPFVKLICWLMVRNMKIKVEKLLKDEA